MGPDRSGLERKGLDWNGTDWIGLEGTGLDWTGLERVKMVKDDDTCHRNIMGATTVLDVVNGIQSKKFYGMKPDLLTVMETRFWFIGVFQYAQCITSIFAPPPATT